MAKGVIIGAGIAGLTTALALKRYGVEIDIYESAPQIKPIGAGIWMAPNAMQIFDRLGIADKVNTQGVPLQKILIADKHVHPLLRTNQEKIKERFGFTTTALKRSALQEILLQEVGMDKVFLNKTCISVHNENNGLRISFADGSYQLADYIIAADGIHSNIRSQIFPQVHFRNTGHACWRGMAKCELQPNFKKSIIECWADGYRFGFSEVEDGVVDWFAVQKDDVNIPQKQGIKSALKHTFKEFSYPVQAILEATDEVSIFKNILSDFVPLSKWYLGKVCLIGDAAHASTPYMGQGGCQAIEDAYALALCLNSNIDIENSFMNFQNLRRPKAVSVVKMSRLMGHIGYLHGMAGDLRNIIMRYTPQLISHHQFCKVYRLNF